MDYDKAASYWEEKSASSVKMPRDALRAEMEQFIEEHNTCALATGSGDFVRCTPIEYSYRGGMLWMFSEGGLKFLALKSNKNVCIAIFEPYAGFGKLAGMQISGTARMVEPLSREYLDLLELKKIPVESLAKLPHELNLICITPVRIDFLWSEFKKMGYDSRQSLTF